MPEEAHVSERTHPGTPVEPPALLVVQHVLVLLDQVLLVLVVLHPNDAGIDEVRPVIAMRASSLLRLEGAPTSDADDAVAVAAVGQYPEPLVVPAADLAQAQAAHLLPRPEQLHGKVLIDRPEIADGPLAELILLVHVFTLLAEGRL